jgi:predicted nucleic acid-binding protein
VILIDTSVWAEHFDHAIEALVGHLAADLVLIHPFVIGELAMGNLKRRRAILEDFHRLPRAVVAADHEVLDMIERHKLFGRGIGYVDAHLLAGARLSEATSLWTFDKRLEAAAIQIGVAHPSSG